MQAEGEVQSSWAMDQQFTPYIQFAEHDMPYGNRQASSEPGKEVKSRLEL
jgi:hypothetical protein